MESEIERLKAEVERLTELVYLPKILPDDEIVTYRDHAESLLRRNQTTRSDAIQEALDAIEDLRKAYPEDIFEPVANDETAKVHERWPGIVDRISAHMARHILDVLAAALEQLKGEGE